jgi:non-ribosomal peptide synthetase component E (peptide arylation enzyme)
MTSSDLTTEPNAALRVSDSAQLATRMPTHPTERAEAFVQAGVWSTETTVQQFWHTVERWPDRQAVWGQDLQLTYRELDDISDRVAAGLNRAGLAPQDRVLIQVGNSTEAVVGWYALLKAGAVPVATLAAHRAHEIATIGTMVGARGHLVDATVANAFLLGFAIEQAAESATMQMLWRVGETPPGAGAAVGSEIPRLLEIGADIDQREARETVRAIQQGLSADGVAVFQLSGGTTGTPKVIPRLHAEYFNNAVFNSHVLERDERSRIAHALPVIHNAGMVHAVFGAHAVGGCAVVVPFSPGDIALPVLIEAGVNDMMIAGPMLSWLAHGRWDDFAAQLEVMTYAGAKCPEHVFDRVTAQGVWVGQIWGMAEGPFTTTPRSAPLEARKNSVGQPLNPLDDYRLRDLAGSGQVPVGEVGLLTYRGPCTLAGYFDADEHNARAFDPEGYLDTGDLAKVTLYDGLAYLSIEGRVKDVISRGGEKISVEEVEKLLLRHPSICEVAVVAMPDELMGDRACAFVALHAGAPPLVLADLQAHFEGIGVAKFKWPERLELIEALPRTNTLKIDRVRLRREISGVVEREHGNHS